MLENLSHIGEFGLIDWIRKTAPTSKNVIAGIGDDTAVLKWTAKKHLLFTTDMRAEGVHFTRATPPRLIGRKALACNISDIAAMGGLPKAAVVALGVAKNISVRFVEQIYRGIYQLAREFKIDIVGGDTIKNDKLMINISLLGEVAKNRVVLRSGAKEGDVIFVTGPLGRSLPSGRHLTFVPRIREAQFLVQRCKPSAMIDISDGLAADLGHLLEESRVGAVLQEEQIPRNKGAALKEALYDGEDFELLFTLNSRKAKQLREENPRDMRFYPIGKIVPCEQGMTLGDKSGKRVSLPAKGFTHF